MPIFELDTPTIEQAGLKDSERETKQRKWARKPSDQTARPGAGTDALDLKSPSVGISTRGDVIHSAPDVRRS
jgi:hypothetical protein